MKLPFRFLILFIFLFNVSHAQKAKQGAGSTPLRSYAEMITPAELSAQLHFFASDHFEGRATGTRGQTMAAYYLASTLAAMDVPPVKRSDTSHSPEDYFQPFPFTRGNVNGTSHNVFGLIEGSDPKLKSEIIILSAHYDHLGKDSTLQGDQIYNGAADDGSGTVALLEMAESFAVAKKNGQGPKRSILFAFFSGEEIGIVGSYHYVMDSPVFPLESVVADINLDGVAGVDKNNPSGKENYVYVLQNDSTSAHLGEKTKALNSSLGINLNIVKPANPGRFASDSRPFEYMLVPTIYFSTGLTEHYHKVSDEPTTIDYNHMARITKLIFSLAWELGNSPSGKSRVQRMDYEMTGKYFCPPCGCDKDNHVFEASGRCPSCNMQLNPVWKKKGAR